MSDSTSTLITVTGLWKKDGKQGPYLTGSLGNCKLFVFPVKDKVSERSPDYRVCIGPAPKKDGLPPRQIDPGDDIPF
jgi:hypothetical protein